MVFFSIGYAYGAWRELYHKLYKLVPYYSRLAIVVLCMVSLCAPVELFF